MRTEKLPQGLDEQDMDVLRNANPDMLNQTVGMASHEELDQWDEVKIQNQEHL